MRHATDRDPPVPPQRPRPAHRPGQRARRGRAAGRHRVAQRRVEPAGARAGRVRRRSLGRAAAHAGRRRTASGWRAPRTCCATPTTERVGADYRGRGRDPLAPGLARPEPRAGRGADDGRRRPRRRRRSPTCAAPPGSAPTSACPPPRCTACPTGGRTWPRRCTARASRRATGWRPCSPPPSTTSRAAAPPPAPTWSCGWRSAATPPASPRCASGAVVGIYEADTDLTEGGTRSRLAGWADGWDLWTAPEHRAVASRPGCSGTPRTGCASRASAGCWTTRSSRPIRPTAPTAFLRPRRLPRAHAHHPRAGSWSSLPPCPGTPSCCAGSTSGPPTRSRWPTCGSCSPTRASPTSART